MKNSIRYFCEKSMTNIEKLEVDFLKDPASLAEQIRGLRTELLKLGTEMVKEWLEEMDQKLQDSPVRRKKWVIEAHHEKTLLTSLGDVTFQKTLFQNKETKEYSYLLDRILGLKPKQRLTEDAIAKILEETVQTSYQRGAESVSETAKISRQTVKNILHALTFPSETETANKKKKRVDYLYIDADEDHVALQFREKKGDLVTASNGKKNNGLIAKIVYVYEGKTQVAPHGKRKELIHAHYFCGVNNGNENLKFWDEIYQYLDQNYDLDAVKKIYLNADGGNWIQSGMRQIKGITYVLDEFHLEKYLLKLIPHKKVEDRTKALGELRKTIQNKTKKEFQQIVEKQKQEWSSFGNQSQVEQASEYLLKNWTGAKRRFQRQEGIVGSSTESHVSHILSDRMSSRPMGWSKTGAGAIAQLRAYYFNGGDMLELVRYQKKENPKETEEEKEFLSSTQILSSEKNQHGELGKYSDCISHSISREDKKMIYFNSHIWGL